MGKEKYVAYVGTYTNGASEGIHLYDVDVEEGTLSFRKVIPVNNCSHVTLSKKSDFLYTISDDGVEVFKIAPDGDLERMNKVNIDGMRGCHLGTDITGKYLFVAGYHDGKITVIHTRRDGTLGRVMDGVFHKPTGTVAERNFRPHVCNVRPTRDNKYLCAVDNGIDQVIVYRINNEKHKLERVEILRMQRDSGPKVVRFSKDGRFMYVLCELQKAIVVYSYRDAGKKPIFEKVQEISTILKPDDRVNMYNAAQAMNISPDQKYLYSTTAGENTMCLFKIDEETGMLEKRFTLPISGEYPKSIVPFPDGRHVAVVNNSSNTVNTFTVDYEKNTLIMKGRPQKVDQPNCIIFKKLDDPVEDAVE